MLIVFFLKIKNYFFIDLNNVRNLLLNNAIDAGNHMKYDRDRVLHTVSEDNNCLYASAQVIIWMLTSNIHEDRR